MYITNTHTELSPSVPTIHRSSKTGKKRNQQNCKVEGVLVCKVCFRLDGKIATEGFNVFEKGKEKGRKVEGGREKEKEKKLI